MEGGRDETNRVRSGSRALAHYNYAPCVRVFVGFWWSVDIARGKRDDALLPLSRHSTPTFTQQQTQQLLIFIRTLTQTHRHTHTHIQTQHTVLSVCLGTQCCVCPPPSLCWVPPLPHRHHHLTHTHTHKIISTSPYIHTHTHTHTQNHSLSITMGKRSEVVLPPREHTPREERKDIVAWTKGREAR